jgi:hypothetical protein
MKPSELNDRQKKLIMDRVVSDEILGQRFGMSANSIGAVRAAIKRKEVQ